MEQQQQEAGRAHLGSGKASILSCRWQPKAFRVCCGLLAAGRAQRILNPLITIILRVLPVPPVTICFFPRWAKV